MLVIPLQACWLTHTTTTYSSTLKYVWWSHVLFYSCLCGKIDPIKKNGGKVTSSPILISKLQIDYKVQDYESNTLLFIGCYWIHTSWHCEETWTPGVIRGGTGNQDSNYSCACNPGDCSHWCRNDHSHWSSIFKEERWCSRWNRNERRCC